MKTMGKGNKKHKKKKTKNKKTTPVKRKEIKINNLEELSESSKNKKIKNDNEGKRNKMSYEIVKERIGFDNGFISFLKWNYIDTRKLKNFKDKIKDNSKIYSIDKSEIEKITGLLSEDNLQNYVNNFIPYSVILHAKIELIAPYFSRDDDEFYLIQNPCLKEKVFKVPMVRGSSWKGVIVKAFRELINESDKKAEIIQSYLRIFGTGSSEFKKLEETIKGFVEKGKNLSKDDLIKYLLFELGFKLKKDDMYKINNDNKRVEFIKEKFWSEIEKNSNKELTHYLTTHKGRAIFYPTYFDKLSLEIINPHSRKTRAGTNPIHYEVVPKDTKGILQIVYIPFDGVLKSNDKLKVEVEQDIKFLIQAIEKAQSIGIGAKEKLGWGRFEIYKRSEKKEDKRVFTNVEGVNIPEGWK